MTDPTTLLNDYTVTAANTFIGVYFNYTDYFALHKDSPFYMQIYLDTQTTSFGTDNSINFKQHQMMNLRMSNKMIGAGIIGDVMAYH